ncbi:MAG: hypothetical protein ACREBW_10470 [Candidatus Micrarchaeaceae archaeon]
MQKDIGIEITNPLEYENLLKKPDEHLICRLAVEDAAEQKSASMTYDRGMQFDVQDGKIIINEIINEIYDMYILRSGFHLLRSPHEDIVKARVVHPYTYREDDDDPVPDDSRQKEALVKFKMDIMLLLKEVVEDRGLLVLRKAIEGMILEQKRKDNRTAEFYM